MNCLHIRKTLFHVLLLVLLCGCSAKVERTNTFESDDGYKPVIYYNGNYYWLSVEKPPVELPEGMVDSQRKIEMCMDDPMQLPNKEGATSAKNCGSVDDRIYINELDESMIITGSQSDQYRVYEKEQ